MKRSSVIFLAILISSCGVFKSPAKVSIPQVQYKSVTELEAEQMNCGPLLDAQISAISKGDYVAADKACAATLKCYREVWKLWENNYREVEAQLNSMYSRSQNDPGVLNNP